MKRWIAGVVGLAIAVAAEEPRPEVRVAVIGGMAMSGIWAEAEEAFEVETGWKVRLVAAGPKPVIEAAVRDGGVDLATMHEGPEAARLAAEGWTTEGRPWAMNEHVVLGPRADPAGVRGMRDGAEALRRIASARMPFVDFRGSGSRELAAELWKKAGVTPGGEWFLPDESGRPQEIGAFAASRGAYVIVGRLPVLSGKIAAGGLEILVEGDPAMRRTYVVLETRRERVAEVNAEGARALADWLTGEGGRRFMEERAEREAPGRAVFFPVAPAAGG